MIEMSALKTLIHLFFPHESNNQKAKILHSGSLMFIAGLLIFAQLAISGATRIFPSVLGCASSISPEEVIRLTNERRIQNGLNPLSENSTLSSAAQAKGTDMLNKGYWAHFAPDGTSPWSFFLNFGYKYRYAGENLARDFCSASDAVNAWMNSPTHRENILSTNYKEIGIGIVHGSLAGADTTVVVQFFGSRASEAAATIPIAKAQTLAQTPIPTAVGVSIAPVSTIIPSPTTISTATPTLVPAVASGKILVSPFKTTKDLSLAITGLLLAVLSIDLIVVRRRRIARIGGRTLAHIAFLGMILAVVLILKAGQII